MPTEIEQAILDKDAALLAVADQAKEIARLTKEVADWKFESDDKVAQIASLNADVREKIDEEQESSLRQKKLFDKAKTVQMAAQNEAEVSNLNLAASEAEKAVVDEALVAKTQEADEMRNAYAAHQNSAKAAITALETKVREQDGRIGDLIRAAAAVPA